MQSLTHEVATGKCQLVVELHKFSPTLNGIYLINHPWLWTSEAMSEWEKDIKET